MLTTICRLPESPFTFRSVIYFHSGYWYLALECPPIMNQFIDAIPAQDLNGKIFCFRDSYFYVERLPELAGSSTAYEYYLHKIPQLSNMAARTLTAAFREAWEPKCNSSQKLLERFKKSEESSGMQCFGMAQLKQLTGYVFIQDLVMAEVLDDPEKTKPFRRETDGHVEVDMSDDQINVRISFPNKMDPSTGNIGNANPFIETQYGDEYDAVHGDK